MLPPAHLVLEDGTIYRGIGRSPPKRLRGGGLQHGHDRLPGDSHRSVVRGQMVVMTYPLIGNYGVNEADIESARIRRPDSSCAKNVPDPSHWRVLRRCRTI